MEAIDRLALRIILGLPEKLPANFEGRFENVQCPTVYWRWGLKKPEWRERQQFVVTTTVIIKPTRRCFWQGRLLKSSKHRVFVICPHCQREIPAGRWHQHLPIHV